MRQHRVRAGWVAVAALLAGFGTVSRAQDGLAQDGTAQQGARAGGGRGQFAGMQRVTGVVTAVKGESLTVKAEDGTAFQVVTTANTRIMKGQGETAKIAEVKVGDGVMAAGNLDAPNKSLHAAMMFVQDAEQVKKLRENLGKTYISGKVTALDADNLKMTVMRPDGVAQTIGFDESTSFRRGGRLRVQMGAGGAPSGGSEGGESITLADIKVGDNVAGTGAVKAGTFVPAQLNLIPTRAPGAGRGPRGAGTPGAGGPGAGASGAGTPPASPQ